MFASPESIKESIRPVLRNLMDAAIHQARLQTSSRENLDASIPLYASLIPDEIFRQANFEQSFVAHFKNAWEELTATVIHSGLGYGIRNYSVRGNIKSGRLVRIQRILNMLENPKNEEKTRKPNWNSELAYVLEGRGQPIPVKVTCDLYVENAAKNKKYVFELEAPVPNKKQIRESKEKILKLYCMETRQIDDAYFVLPYHSNEHHKTPEWGIFAKWFDLQNDPVVLIGEEFWERIAGPDTFRAFIQAVNEIGSEYKRNFQI
jgi:hypothetical protein